MEFIGSEPKFEVLVVQVMASVEVRICPPCPPATHRLLPKAIEFMVVAEKFEVTVTQTLGSPT
jgi:hypothetical protein